MSKVLYFPTDPIPARYALIVFSTTTAVLSARTNNRRMNKNVFGYRSTYLLLAHTYIITRISTPIKHVSTDTSTLQHRLQLGLAMLVLPRRRLRRGQSKPMWIVDVRNHNMSGGVVDLTTITGAATTDDNRTSSTQKGPTSAKAGPRSFQKSSSLFSTIRYI